MKKLPRDVNAHQLIKLLGKHYGYIVSRQTGSHVRITTSINGEHHITIPNHNPIKTGTLSSILNAVALHHQLRKDDLIDNIF